jgi:hypothetical protein
MYNKVFIVSIMWDENIVYLYKLYDEKSEALNGPPPLPQKPVELMGSLKRYPMQRSAPEIRNLWNDRSNMPNISSRTTLSDLAEAYFDSMQK